MELSAYTIVKKIHKVISTGEPTAITSAEIAYITGLLEALLTTYGPEVPAEAVEQKRTFLDGVKDKLGV